MEKKSSPQFKSRTKPLPGTTSDSEGSIESSPSVDSLNDVVPKTPPPKDPGHGHLTGKRAARRESEWEILEGLRDGQRFERRPDSFGGHLHKKRKWPLKGWHKRYFVLDKGVLAYGKSPSDVARGKLHGSLDIGLSVISAKPARRRIDIDAEEFIYHIKAKAGEEFSRWVELLTEHRLYRQHQLCFGTRGQPQGHREADSPLTEGSGDGGGGVVTGGGGATAPPDALRKELAQAAHNLAQLAKIREALGDLDLASAGAAESNVSPGPRKERRKFGLRKKKSTKGSCADLAGSPARGTAMTAGGDLTELVGVSKGLSASTTSLAVRPASLADDIGLDFKMGAPPELKLAPPDFRVASATSTATSTSTSTDCQLREDFTVLAKDIHNSLQLCCYRLLSEREPLPVGGASSALRTALRSALAQNAELRDRLAQIHAAADLGAISSPAADNHKGSLSYSSSCLSASEFFDAEERQHDTSSEVNSLSSEENNSTENSDAGTEYTPPEKHTYAGSGRRTRLPVPRPDMEGLSLWNLLCKNIGQDLSQVSMPVALNEPLNMLQRLCEELEYSELLDQAAEASDALERITLVAAFAVSGYAASFHRAGSKPFNPLLGETYECVREDRGFRFISEQVSHHPPVSVCHAESKNFVFWQDARIKTKFWGKSMEFQPTGAVNVLLPKHDEVYRWNKVTTCVHNLFSGQRWVDQYGELRLSCGKLQCKLTFVKASYWSAKRHEVFGTVTGEGGKVLRHISGKWSEALYCGKAPAAKCIWRPGAMPEDHELYYGFTRFAMELNEIDADAAKYLPKTDTRFRPDQRLLEEGDLSAAESLKMQLEQNQRERRKRNEQANIVHQPLWFSKTSDEGWEANQRYWESRSAPGFMNMQLDALW